jgi:hypothetical protein
MDTANLEHTARRYRDAEAALDAARTNLQTEVIAFLQQHASERGAQTTAATITGWSREHLRGLRKKADDEAERARREAEVEALRRKVEELSTTGEPQPAAVAPRVQVSAVVPSEPLPEMSPREFRKVVARAMSRAKPDQRERLNLTAKTAEQLGRDKNDAVLKVAFELGLLKHDEVYGTTEETTA